jgi:hypothetical protein
MTSSTTFHLDGAIADGLHRMQANFSFGFGSSQIAALPNIGGG